ncbi:MAG: dienelactone hydrolase family protein [Alphaproteobacteria bacterium]|nr:dienelactone hydrolase family protein [Alphaproteobacteria bacterium]
MVWLILALAGHLLGAAQAAEQVVVTSVASGERIPAELQKSDGQGRFPAVVILHDCSGLGTPSSGAPQRWSDELVERGYVTLIPDSFGPRGFPTGVCLEAPDRAKVAAPVRAGDAYGALAYLRTLPFVDGRHVGVMGGSHGGWSTLAAMYEPARDDNPLRAAKRDGFAAGLALYPGCAAPFGTWAVQRDGHRLTGHTGVYKPIAPLLILIGEKDDWTPAEPCRWLAETAQAEGYPVEIKVYPGAHHAFDSYAPLRWVPGRNNPNHPSGLGATTSGDPSAWADARKQVAAFFAKHLKPAP